MSDRTELPNDSQQSAEPQAVDGVRRRRLLKGGLAVAPILMTLASRPALGQACATPSAFGSVTHASHPHTNHIACSGRQPEYWANNTTEWPSGYLAVAASGNEATLFHTPFPGNQFPAKTLLDILQTSDVAGDAFVARYLVAALFNASLGSTPVLTESAVQNIWLEYVSNGYFEPTASVQWFAEQIVDYVQSTFG